MLHIVAINLLSILYDEKTNTKILPPLLRSSNTVIYTEFRDYLIYLNLPVFRSTVHKNILFFPNFDTFNELIKLHNKYGDQYKQFVSNDFAWFRNDDAKKAISEFCNKYLENYDKNYGIEPVKFYWFNVLFDNMSEKYTFLVATLDEFSQYYNKSKGLYSIKNKSYFLYNDMIRWHVLIKLNDMNDKYMFVYSELFNDEVFYITKCNIMINDNFFDYVYYYDGIYFMFTTEKQVANLVNIIEKYYSNNTINYNIDKNKITKCIIVRNDNYSYIEKLI